MKKKYIIYGLILCILFVYLIWIAFGAMVGGLTHSKRIGNTNYSLMEDVSTFIALYYTYPDDEGIVGVVEGHITDAYWNEQYILVTQYNGRKDSIKGYYIVQMLPPVEKGVPWKKIKCPTKEEYEQKKQELSLNEKDMKHTIF